MSLTLTRRHNVDRFGYLIPTRYGNLPMVGAVATYRPGEGRFGGAVAVEEGTTNLLPASKAEAEANPDITANAIWSIDTTRMRTGSGSLRVEWNGSGTYSQAEYRLNVTPGQTYTFSAYAYVESSGYKGEIALQEASTPFRQIGSGLIDLVPGKWNRLSVTWTLPSDINLPLRCQVRTPRNASGQYVTGVPIWWDSLQLEQKPFATSFVDGSREAGVLRYPQLLDKKRGTLSVWINPHVLVNWNNFFEMHFSTGRFLLFFGEKGLSCWDFGPANSGPSAPAGTVAAGRWTMHTLTWDADAGVYRYYVNGEFVGERQYVEPDSLPSALPTVINRGALLDELLILPYAASEEEIVSWYEAQGPLPPHPQASLQWDRQTVRPAQMVKL